MQESKKDVTGTIRMHVVHFKQSSVLLSTSRTLEFVEDTLNRHKCSLGIAVSYTHLTLPTIYSV